MEYPRIPPLLVDASVRRVQFPRQASHDGSRWRGQSTFDSGWAKPAGSLPRTMLPDPSALELLRRQSVGQKTATRHPAVTRSTRTAATAVKLQWIRDAALKVLDFLPIFGVPGRLVSVCGPARGPSEVIDQRVEATREWLQRLCRCCLPKTSLGGGGSDECTPSSSTTSTRRRG